MAYRSSCFLVCDLAISVGLLGMFWKVIKCRYEFLGLRSELPLSLPHLRGWTAAGQVVSPLQRNDTFIFDLGKPISDQNHRST